MNSRNRDFLLLATVLVLFAAAFALKVPRMSALDLIFIGAAGLVAMDVRRNFLK